MADSLRVLALGDLHLTEGKRQADQEAVLRGIMRDADRLKPQLTCVLGDVFGHRVPHASSPWPRNMMVEFTRVMTAYGPVVFILGNHDIPEDLSIFEDIRVKSDVHVFAGPEDAVITVRGDIRVCLRVLPYPRRTTFDAGDRPLQEVVDETMARFAATRPVGAFSLFLGHVQVAGCRLGGGEVLHGKEPVITPEQLKALPVDACVLGHIHLSQQMAPRSWYAGSPWPQDFGETDRKGYLVIDIGKRSLNQFDPVMSGFEQPLGELIESVHAPHVHITRMWTHAPPLVTLDWRWGLRDGDREPSWLVAPAALTQRAHVKGRLTVDPEYKASCPWREATAAFRATALSWVEEVKTLTRSGVRAPAVAEAVGLDNKLHAYWGTLTPPPAEDIRHGAINALWDMQDGTGPMILATIAAERLT
jgi:DNA repair exonuclease SbcCD nuclease subunit